MTLVYILAAAAPALGQTPSRFSPRAPSGGASPSGPSLAIYTGIMHGGGESGTAVSVQVEIGHVGPVRALLGVLPEPGAAGAAALEAGVVVQPGTAAKLAPYIAVTAFARNLFEGESGGVAFHVGADVVRSRELALRLEGRAYLSDATALGLMIGIAMR